MSGKRKPALTISPQESSDEEGDRASLQAQSPSGSRSGSGRSGSGRSGSGRSGSGRSGSGGSGLLSEYEDVSSPGGSSTASGPIYVRTPGFTEHAHSVVQPTTSSSSSKGKKKKGLITPDLTEVIKKAETPPTTRTRPKKEPLPMKLRALPQSFWQQPNVACDVSPAAMYPTLPPLFNKEAAEDVAEVRPVTPPDAPGDTVSSSPSPISSEASSSASIAGVKPSGQQRLDSRMVTVANPDLLYRLFDRVQESRRGPVVKRGRPKKPPSTLTTKILRDDDPCMVSMVTETLLPLLPSSSDGVRNHFSLNMPPGRAPVHHTLTMVPIRDGDKSVSLPALNVDHNYSQLLSELVVKL